MSSRDFFCTHPSGTCFTAGVVQGLFLHTSFRDLPYCRCRPGTFSAHILQGPALLQVSSRDFFCTHPSGTCFTAGVVQGLFLHTSFRDLPYCRCRPGTFSAHILQGPALQQVSSRDFFCTHPSGTCLTAGVVQGLFLHTSFRDLSYCRCSPGTFSAHILQGPALLQVLSRDFFCTHPSGTALLQVSSRDFFCTHPSGTCLTAGVVQGLFLHTSFRDLLYCRCRPGTFSAHILQGPALLQVSSRDFFCTHPSGTCLTAGVVQGLFLHTSFRGLPYCRCSPGTFSADILQGPALQQVSSRDFFCTHPSGTCFTAGVVQGLCLLHTSFRDLSYCRCSPGTFSAHILQGPVLLQVSSRDFFCTHPSGTCLTAGVVQGLFLHTSFRDLPYCRCCPGTFSAHILQGPALLQVSSRDFFCTHPSGTCLTAGVVQGLFLHTSFRDLLYCRCRPGTFSAHILQGPALLQVSSRDFFCTHPSGTCLTAGVVQGLFLHTSFRGLPYCRCSPGTFSADILQGPALQQVSSRDFFCTHPSGTCFTAGVVQGLCLLHTSFRDLSYCRCSPGTFSAHILQGPALLQVSSRDFFCTHPSGTCFTAGVVQGLFLHTSFRDLPYCRCHPGTFSAHILQGPALLQVSSRDLFCTHPSGTCFTAGVVQGLFLHTSFRDLLYCRCRPGTFSAHILQGPALLQV